jgi:hypothetical protein
MIASLSFLDKSIRMKKPHDRVADLVRRTKKISYLEENAGASQISLTADEVKEIREFVDAAEVHGERASDA